MLTAAVLCATTAVLGCMRIKSYFEVYNRTDLQLCLQTLALTILSFRRIMVAVSNRSSKKKCDEAAPFWIA